MERLRKFSKHLGLTAHSSDSVSNAPGLVSNEHYADSLKLSQKKKISRKSPAKRSTRRKGGKRQLVGQKVANVEVAEVGCVIDTLTGEANGGQDAVMIQDGEWKTVASGWKTTTKLAVEFTRGSVRSSKKSLDSAYGSIRRNSKRRNRKAKRKTAKEVKSTSALDEPSRGVSSQRNPPEYEGRIVDCAANNDVSDFPDDSGGCPATEEDLISTLPKNMSGWKTTTKLAVDFTRGNTRSSRTSIDSAIGSWRENALIKRPAMLKPDEYNQNKETQVEQQNVQELNDVQSNGADWNDLADVNGDGIFQAENAVKDGAKKVNKDADGTGDVKLSRDLRTNNDKQVLHDEQKDARTNTEEELSPLDGLSTEQPPAAAEDQTLSELDNVEKEVNQMRPKVVFQHLLKEKLKTFKRSSSRGLHRGKWRSQSSDEESHSSTESLNCEVNSGGNTIRGERKVQLPRESSINEENSQKTDEPKSAAECETRLPAANLVKKDLESVKTSERNTNSGDRTMTHADKESNIAEDISGDRAAAKNTNSDDGKVSKPDIVSQTKMESNAEKTMAPNDTNGEITADGKNLELTGQPSGSPDSADVREENPSGETTLDDTDNGETDQKLVAADGTDDGIITDAKTSTKQETATAWGVANLSEKWKNATEKSQRALSRSYSICEKCSTLLPRTTRGHEPLPQISRIRFSSQTSQNASTTKVPRRLLHKKLRRHGSVHKELMTSQKSQAKRRPKMILQSSVTLKTVSTQQFKMSTTSNAITAGISLKTGQCKVLRRLSSSKLSLTNNYTTFSNSVQQINNPKENSLLRILSTADCGNAIVRELVAVNADLCKDLVQVKKRLQMLEERCPSPCPDIA